ncbi:ribosome inactivating protein [Streptomyces sp. TLI_55]|uniref:ribosome-inactivating family protein n=1 Tax=Streptomyces sp. TLI_55 TaxID=1938861 RepID=UPI000BC49093|nr:ribosome-inactivating family protein [Streptomyces sp. TLI_55]SNX62614.1 ribosome inactivating protein [Streptomyces sp. TLI_55]
MAHTDEKPRQRTRRLTIGMIITTLVLSIFATLVGPLGQLSTASAQDRIPRFQVGNQNRWDYWGFINQIRRQVNGSDNRVPGSSNTIDHTAGDRDWIDVDIQMWENPNFVRIRLRRGDLYLMGWWSNDGVYNRLGGEAESGTPAVAWNNQGQVTQWAPNRPTNFNADYPNLESRAGVARNEMGFSRDSLNTAAWNLYNARTPTDRDGGNQAATEIRNQARAVLTMTQFLSEATRFRGIATRLGYANDAASDHDPVYIPWQVVGSENNWGTLSNRFNRWLQAARAAGNAGVPDPDRGDRMGAFTIDNWNNLVGVTVTALADYALILNTANRG